MRYVTPVVVILASVPAWADTVQLSKSTYHDQHVTVEDNRARTCGANSWRNHHCHCRLERRQPQHVSRDEPARW